MLLRDQVVPALQENNTLLVVTFMQDGAPKHIAHSQDFPAGNFDSRASNKSKL